MSAAGGTENECGGCTVCCTVLQVDELRKPCRRSCDHVGSAGCGIYELRPTSCRVFSCAWLRGALPGVAGPELKPNELGVMVDRFRRASEAQDVYYVFEVWTGALDRPEVIRLIERLRQELDVKVNRRDGCWTTLRGMSPPACEGEGEGET